MAEGSFYHEKSRQKVIAEEYWRNFWTSALSLRSVYV